VLTGSASLNCATISENIKLLTSSLSIPVFIGGVISNTCRDDIAEAGAYPLGHDLSGGVYTIANTLNRSNQ